MWAEQSISRLSNVESRLFFMRINLDISRTMAAQRAPSVASARATVYSGRNMKEGLEVGGWRCVAGGEQQRNAYPDPNPGPSPQSQHL